MGGIWYTIGEGPLRTSFSLVGGYAFTSAKVTAALPSGTAASIDITDAWVVRPNVGFTYTLTRRLRGRRVGRLRVHDADNHR